MLWRQAQSATESGTGSPDNAASTRTGIGENRGWPRAPRLLWQAQRRFPRERGCDPHPLPCARPGEDSADRRHRTAGRQTRRCAVVQVGEWRPGLPTHSGGECVPTTTGTDTLITIDTLSTALATDSISIADGLISNNKADTVRWQVRYDFFYDATNADLGIAFGDLTADGTEVPTAIPGSKARAEQRSTLGIAMPGRTFHVDVPPGEKIRLCFKGDVGTTTAVDIRDLTISINEINR